MGSEKKRAPARAEANGQNTIASRRGDGEQELFVSVVGGLAGSSCCVIQLGLIFLSELGVQPVGCAGFNKILGPLRLYLRAATLLYFMYKWLLDKRCCSKRRLTIYFLLSMCLMFMPEALRYSSNMTNGLAALAPSTVNAEKLVYTVDNMGCEACETHVKRIVESFDGVVYVESVDYETGLMKLTVNRDWNFDQERLDAKLEAEGYDLLPMGSTTKRMKWESDAAAHVFGASDL